MPPERHDQVTDRRRRQIRQERLDDLLGDEWSRVAHKLIGAVDLNGLALASHEYQLLLDYGQHHRDCPGAPDCDCGWSEALRRLTIEWSTDYPDDDAGTPASTISHPRRKDRPRDN